MDTHLRRPDPHLSIDTYGCKQKCTQFLTPFSGTVFYAPSHGVNHFARSVSPRNHFLTAGNSLTANQKLQHSEQNGSHHVKGYEKPC